MRMSVSLGAVLVGIALFALPSQAQERTVAKLFVTPQAGAPQVEVWLTRARGADGALTVRLVERGVGERPQSLTIYRGGGGDDSAGDDDLRALKGSVMALPGRNVVRVDFTYHPADGQPSDEQTDTTLVGFAGPKTHKLLKLRTRVALERSKLCRQSAEVTLSPEGPAAADGSFILVATAVNRAEPKLGDDDAPLDPTCRAPAASEKKLYRFDGQRLVEWTAPKVVAPVPDGGVDAAKPAAAD